MGMIKGKILQAMWNELYKQEAECEDKFIADPNLDVSDWILYRHWFQLGHAIGIKVISEQMEDKPEVVMCVDCRYWQDNNDGYPHPDCKWDHDETPDPDDFCSAGERKDNG